MTGFHRIEARITDRDELKEVAQQVGILATQLQAIAHDKSTQDEAAMLLARERIKTISQRMRKGLKNASE